MDLNLLRFNYESSLRELIDTDFIDGEDKYSGVFLSYPFPEYESTKKRVMIVGRETAGWNTKNGKNTILRIVERNEEKDTQATINEAFERYSWHLLDKKGGVLKRAHRSHFQRFYHQVANRLGLKPQELIYANLFAWDYDGRSPTIRSKKEFEVVQNVSVKLLAESINFCKPEIIIFAVGCNVTNDETIKLLMNEFFGGYNTTELVSKKYWRFSGAGMDCFRIAHPRASSSEHQKYRSLVLENVCR